MFDFKKISLDTLSLWILISLLIIIAVAITAFAVLNKIGKKNIITTKDLTYGAICLAISFGLSFIGIKLPQGGTLTPASTFPVMIYTYYFGLRKGSIVCTAFMLLQFVQQPYISHPMSAVLDYVIPYMALVMIGVFSYRQKRYDHVIADKKHILNAHVPFFVGAGAYALIRYLSHVLSGIIFYADFVQWGLALVPYSLVYNLFSIMDAAICMVVAVGVLSSKTFNTFMASNRNTVKNTDAAAKND